MVFMKFSHFARPSLNKTFVHGYAQSLVAATQTSSPAPFLKQHKEKQRRASTTRRPGAFGSITPFSSSVDHARTASTSLADRADGFDRLQCSDRGAAASYDAWLRLQRNGGEVREWQHGSDADNQPDAKLMPRTVKAEELVFPPPTSEITDHLPIDQPKLERSYSTSALDDIASPERVDSAKTQIATTHAAQEITSTSEFKKETRSSDLVLPTSHLPDQESIISDEVSTISSRTRNKDTLSNPSTKSDLTGDDPAAASDFLTTSPFDALNDHLQSRSFAAVVQTFTSLIQENHSPTAAAYDALLTATYHLHDQQATRLQRMYDIYKDMQARRVTPLVTTYEKMIDLFLDEASSHNSAQKQLAVETRRYENLDTNFEVHDGRSPDQMMLSKSSLSIAIQTLHDALNALSVSTQPIDMRTYARLIISCAAQGAIADMIATYGLLEKQPRAKFMAEIFPPMITAFACQKNILSAMECYNEYRAMAIRDDHGEYVIAGRCDYDVYTALIRAFYICGKSENGRRFFAKVSSMEISANKLEAQQGQTRDLDHAILSEAYVRAEMDRSNFGSALKILTDSTVLAETKKQIRGEICVRAADCSQNSVAVLAYSGISFDASSFQEATLALIAMHLRARDVNAAVLLWSQAIPKLKATEECQRAFKYLVMILRGMDKADQICSVLHDTLQSTLFVPTYNQRSDQSKHLFFDILESTLPLLSVSITKQLLHFVVEHHLDISPRVLIPLLDKLDPTTIMESSPTDVQTFLYLQARCLNSQIIDNHDQHLHIRRMCHLLGMANSLGLEPDSRKFEVVSTACQNFSKVDPELRYQWTQFTGSYHFPRSLSGAKVGGQDMMLSANHDPYDLRIDAKGSAAILDILSSSGRQSIHKALARFRNIRRAGLHPRLPVYAKLISAASKDHQLDLALEILTLARQDVPLLSGHAVSLHGWTIVLDAMMGACLQVGQRVPADGFHNELLALGSAPSANTYGLYITSINESTKSYDEASEAVSIFRRAIAEGVKPTPFLYNALIGKLGKARRIDDCLRYFQEMRAANLHPTSVTYGTVINALCRVSDEQLAEELFDEMESVPSYKPRAAPYNSMMQYFLATQEDNSKILTYFERMQAWNIAPTSHTYKLLIDTYASRAPIDMSMAEQILDTMQQQGVRPEAVHYASIIHAKGCVLHDLAGAQKTFDNVLEQKSIRPSACLFQALAESMVANHQVSETDGLIRIMKAHNVGMTAYIANTLIRGWASQGDLGKSKSIFDSLPIDNKEPSTYEAMTRAHLSMDDRRGAQSVIAEMMGKGYPVAVSGKVCDLMNHRDLCMPAAAS